MRSEPSRLRKVTLPLRQPVPGLRIGWRQRSHGISSLTGTSFPSATAALEMPGTPDDARADEKRHHALAILGVAYNSPPEAEHALARAVATKGVVSDAEAAVERTL